MCDVHVAGFCTPVWLAEQIWKIVTLLFSVPLSCNCHSTLFICVLGTSHVALFIITRSNVLGFKVNADRARTHYRTRTALQRIRTLLVHQPVNHLSHTHGASERARTDYLSPCVWVSHSTLACVCARSRFMLASLPPLCGARSLDPTDRTNSPLERRTTAVGSHS